MKKLILIITAICAVSYIFTACADSAAKQATEAGQIPVSSEAALEPLFTLAPAQISPETEQQEDSLFYSSYAHMRSFDPNTGIAQFDFFELLTGAEAVDYLINCEGYCSAVAEEQVDEYTQGDFLEKNTSAMLREVDMREVSIKLLYSPDESIAADGQSIDFSFEDLVSLWNADKAKVLLTHFYYITADEDTQQVLQVEQLSEPIQ